MQTEDGNSLPGIEVVELDVHRQTPLRRINPNVVRQPALD